MQITDKSLKVENVGGEIHNELWVPSEDLEEFNKHIVGKIEVIAEQCYPAISGN